MVARFIRSPAPYFCPAGFEPAFILMVSFFDFRNAVSPSLRGRTYDTGLGEPFFFFLSVRAQVFSVLSVSLEGPVERPHPPLAREIDFIFNDSF